MISLSHCRYFHDINTKEFVLVGITGWYNTTVGDIVDITDWTITPLLEILLVLEILFGIKTVIQNFANSGHSVIKLEYSQENSQLEYPSLRIGELRIF
jgi:hypothetical protein